MNTIRCITIALLVCFLTNSIAQITDYPEQVIIQDERLLPLKDTIQSWIDRRLIPSMAIGVIQHGKVIWLEAFGLADREKKIPATPQTIYPLGSMSKSISSTGVMTLVEKGKLDLEESVNLRIRTARLQAVKWDTDQVKVWHILNCSAGIPHGWASFNDPQSYPRSDSEKDHFLEQYGVITLPPGQFFSYSNYSFGVADLLMERVSGQPLETYLQENLFGPLGMKNTHTTYFSDLDAPYAMTYHRDLSVFGRLTSIPYGGLGYYSSVADLIRYAALHLKQFPQSEKMILSPENVQRMHHFPQSSSKRFGLGWHDMGHALVSNGSVTGGNSHLSLLSKEELAVICLTNITAFNGYADQMADMIIDALVPDLVRQMTYETYMAEYEPPYQLHPDLAGKWAGTIYTGNQKIPLSLEFPPDGSVMLQVATEKKQKLENVIFNKYGLLNANFSGRIPLPYFAGNEPINYELVLYLTDGELVGHVAGAFSNEEGSFRFGVFTKLQRQ